MVDNYAP